MAQPVSTGLVQVYCGNGKGKTSAALGLAVRAAGHGAKVLFARFMVSCTAYGEMKGLEPVTAVEVVLLGKDVPEGLAVSDYSKYHIEPGKPAAEDIVAAETGLDLCRNALAEGAYDIVVMDEVLYAVEYGLLSAGAVIDAVRARSKGVEAVLTGGRATKGIIRIADLVTEFEEVRHHYRKGIIGVEGIDY